MLHFRQELLVISSDIISPWFEHSFLQDLPSSTLLRQSRFGLWLANTFPHFWRCNFGPQVTNDSRYSGRGLLMFSGSKSNDLHQRGAGVHPSQLPWDKGSNSTAQTAYFHDVSPVSPHTFGVPSGTRVCEAFCFPAAFTNTFGRGKVFATWTGTSAKACTSTCRKKVKPLSCLASNANVSYETLSLPCKDISTSDHSTWSWARANHDWPEESMYDFSIYV